ncbi:MAG: hypothetical protein CVU59_01645 [Deltaproteobacteria bacterium HGW-Deltaproteobacteria-17]|nr:MAG: hypothetical protein CVU59_01645 [Deltaproteobacteria bacterium HGW-Deltaproteobacteria-17]
MRRMTLQIILACLAAVGLFAACDDSSGGGTNCPETSTVCDGVCVDTLHDPANCGECGVPCDEGLACIAGECTLGCGGGTVECNGACVDTELDPANCGACDDPCDAGLVCQGGICSLSCSGGTEDCDGSCVDTQTNRTFCGACDNVCDPGQECVAGACVGDDTPPLVTVTTPDDGVTMVAGDLRVIDITFDEVLHPASVLGTSVTVTNTIGIVSGTVSLLPGGTTIRFSANANLGHLMDVEVTVSGTLADLAYNRMGADYTFSFATAPSMITLNPPVFMGTVDATQTFEVWAHGDSDPVIVSNPTWTITPSAIASIDTAGLLTLLAPGQAVLEAEYNGMTVSAQILCGAGLGQSTLLQASSLIWNGTILYWDFDPDGAIDDGGEDQYDTMWELYIVDDQGNSIGFPDCTIDELAFDAPYEFYTPILADPDSTSSDTLFACNIMGPGGEGVVWQELTLPASPASLSLDMYIRYNLNDSLGPEVGYEIILEDLTGGTGENILSSDSFTGTLSSGWTNVNADLMAWAGQTVRLKIHYIGGGDESPTFRFDDASIQDDQGTEYLVNGGCDTGDSTGWTSVLLMIPREINLAPLAEVNGVQVTRSIYTPYDPGSWVRYLDSFTNHGATDVTFEAAFYGNLGSDGNGYIYTHAGGRAWLEYDEDGSDPPLGVIPGTADYLDIPDYNDNWEVRYSLTLAPGETKSILVFHMYGTSTELAADPFLMTLSEEIIQSVDADGPDSNYLAGLSLSEYNTISNWP